MNDSIIPEEVDIIGVDGNINYKMRYLIFWHYENELFCILNEIANYLLTNYRNYENVPISTEEGPKDIL